MKVFQVKQNGSQTQKYTIKMILLTLTDNTEIKCVRQTVQTNKHERKEVIMLLILRPLFTLYNSVLSVS